MSIPPGTPPLERVLHAAKAQGLLPDNATAPVQASRPWPVVLLTALGAWLAAVPLLIGVGMVLGDLLMQESLAALVMGGVFLAVAVSVLRMPSASTFVEQLAFPGLVVGMGLVGFGLYDTLPAMPAALLMVLLLAGLAGTIDRPWLRVLLGGAAALFMLLACLDLGTHTDHGAAETGLSRLWLGYQVVLALWLAMLAWQAWGLAAYPRLAAVLESFAEGWVLALLGAYVARRTITEVGGLFSSHSWATDATVSVAGIPVSVVLALAAALLCARAWPTLRTVPGALVALVLVALAWWVPVLGEILLVLAVAATTQRWYIAAVAAVVATWAMGQFYYQLTWPLATKAQMLATAGVALGLLAWWTQRRSTTGAATAKPPVPQQHAWATRLVLVSGLFILGAANFAIWQKENTITQGQAVLVELAPRDPRSLMQGDYMALNWRLPSEVENTPLRTRQRPQVVAHKDARGVARLLRLHDGRPALAADEFLIELTPKDGRWVLVTDAWFFKEGDAERFEQARYGEFRVTPQGQALLVGMVDADLRPIPP